MLGYGMNALLNESTRTLHRRERDTAGLSASCGATTHLDADQLRATTVSEATSDGSVAKCGRCFDDGGGY